jgi:uncharacterized Zn-finger protein
MSTPASSPQAPDTASARTVEVSSADLPLHCPMPGTPVWNMHPRVFLDIVAAGDMLCPYCGTRYIFRGEAPKGH